MLVCAENLLDYDSTYFSKRANCNIEVFTCRKPLNKLHLIVLKKEKFFSYSEATLTILKKKL